MPLKKEWLENLFRRIVARVKLVGDCWEWQGYLDRVGYGRITLRRRAAALCRHFYVHRITYLVTFGSIPDDQDIAHTCHNRRCCNPEHLKAISHAENMHEVSCRYYGIPEALHVE